MQEDPYREPSQVVEYQVLTHSTQQNPDFSMLEPQKDKIQQDDIFKPYADAEEADIEDSGSDDEQKKFKSVIKVKQTGEESEADIDDDDMISTIKR